MVPENRNGSIESGDQIDKRSFPGPGGTHHGDRFPGLNPKGYIFEDLFFTDVTEGNIINSDLVNTV
jgi:hypothetical protein